MNSLLDKIEQRDVETVDLSLKSGKMDHRRFAEEIISESQRQVSTHTTVHSREIYSWKKRKKPIMVPKTLPYSVPLFSNSLFTI